MSYPAGSMFLEGRHQPIISVSFSTTEHPPTALSVFAEGGQKGMEESKGAPKSLRTQQEEWGSLNSIRQHCPLKILQTTAPHSILLSSEKTRC